MTTPEDAAATSRDTTNEYIYPASQLENEPVALSTADALGDPPRPVPMTDPIEDVTKPPEGPK